jgi:hypothetical protein
MSANERASALGNWRRLGFDRHQPDAEPGRWIVALLNNRADRAARSASFAEAVVHDLPAHRLVLLGSGLSTLRREIDRALHERLARTPPGEVPELIAYLKIGAADADAALTELEAWWGPHPELVRDRDFPTRLSLALSPVGLETVEEARRGVLDSGAPDRLASVLGAAPDTQERVRFAIQSWIVRRVGAACCREPDHPAVREQLAALFRARILVPPDPNGSADELLVFLARICPPGALADVIGLENIKGPGLAIVRRLIDLDAGVPVETGGGPPPAAGAWARVLGWLRGSIDHVPSVGRRRRADQLYDDLAAGRLSTPRVARELARLVDEQRSP